MNYEDTPKIDYSRYTFTAVIDWLELSIKIQSATNFQTIRRRLNLGYVTSHNAAAGGSATEFSFKIYDVPSWIHVRKLINEIDEQFKLVSEPLITGVEIAFDAYSKYDSADDLILLTAHFFKFIARPVSDNRRFASKVAEGFDFQHKRTIGHFKNGRTAYIGNKADNLYQKAYFKTVDKKKPIEQKHYRARFEVTMVHHSCPFKTIGEAESYKLTNFANWFKFRRIDDELDGLLRQMVELKSTVGLVKPVRRAEGGTRLHSKTTRADTVLGDKAYDALRYLDRKLKRNVRKNRFNKTESAL